MLLESESSRSGRLELETPHGSQDTLEVQTSKGAKDLQNKGREEARPDGVGGRPLALMIKLQVRPVRAAAQKTSMAGGRH